MTDNGEQREQEQPAPVEDIPADEFVYVRSTATGLVQPDPIPRRWLGTELGEGLEEADEGAVRATLDAGRSPTATGPGSMAPEQDPSTMTNFSAPRDVSVENEGPSTGDTAGEEAPVAGADADEGHAEGGADPAAGAPRRGRKRAASGDPAGSAGEAKSQSADTSANTGE
jgi:hypothetical protein